MFLYHLRFAFRNILRERYYALIKIIGLALGIGTSLVLLVYVSHELSYDTFHPDVDRLYRVNQTNIWDPEGSIFGSTGPAVGLALTQDFPEIEEVMRINTPGGYTIRCIRKDGSMAAFNENFNNVFAADSNFFSFFGFALKEGNPKTALVGKNKVVLSDKAALKLFGPEPALGKMIELVTESPDEKTGAETLLVEVTGVTGPQPSNVHFHFDYMLSIYTNPNVKRFDWSWIWTQVVTYVKLRPEAEVEALNEKLRTFADRHAPATFKRIGMDYGEFVREKGEWHLYLQPVKDIRLYSGPQDSTTSIGNRLGPVGNIRYVYVLGAVAVLILMIAMVNFINLSTARAIKRAKEVGVKKTLGVTRKALVLQFQLEHTLLTAFALAGGLCVMELLRLMIQPIGIELPLSVLSTAGFITVLILIPLVVGFAAGIYPSFYLTSFRPAQVFRGKLTSGIRVSNFRNMLVVFQFTISIALISATLIVFQQLNFFRSQDIGFEKENLLIIDRAVRLGTQLEVFREEVSRYPGVVDASAAMNIRAGFEDIFIREGDDRKITLSQYKIDAHFFSVTRLTLVAGRTFDENRPSDKYAVLINETATRLLGWNANEAIGKRIIYGGDHIGPLEIIGVVKDFHFQSLRQNIAPVIFINIDAPMWGDETLTILVKYESKHLQQLIKNIEQKWNTMVQGIPLDMNHYDEEIRMQYAEEERMGSLFSLFSGLSITIAIIGLVGLVSYSAEQRKKEIGIRKVFGASLVQIYILMNSGYVKLLFTSMVIATPLAWWLMQQWLESFANRITIGPSTFLLAGAAELVLALLSVSALAYRAASLNPAQVLKDE